MNIQTRSISLLLLALGLATSPGMAEGDDASLAQRCNAIAWDVDVGSSDLYPPALRALQQELMAAGPAVVEAIAGGLPESLNLRRIASHVLARHPSDRTPALLVELLTDPDEMTAEAAAFALGEVGGIEVIEPLRRAAGESRAMVAHNALGALLSLGAANRSANEALAALRHPATFVRTTALQLVAELRGRELVARGHAAVRILLEAETDAQVSRYAARTLRILDCVRE